MSLTEDKKILVTEKVYFLLTFIHQSFLKGKLRRYGISKYGYAFCRHRQ